MRQELLQSIEMRISRIDPNDAESLKWWNIFKDFVQQFKDNWRSDHLLRIQYKNPADAKRRGIYKISFGEKFYIGRSKLVGQRMVTHETQLNKFLNNPSFMTPENWYYSIFTHIQNNNIDVATVELLDECKTNDDLFNNEQKRLTEAEGNPNCLNNGFVAKRPWNEKEETLEESLKKPIVFNRSGKTVYTKRR